MNQYQKFIEKNIKGKNERWICDDLFDDIVGVQTVHNVVIEPIHEEMAKI